MSTLPLARILVVDDEPANTRALCDTLRDQGYETAGFANGEDALKALRESQFDVLLTDLMMPGMDGVALLAAALKIDPQLVGILMTGQGTIETAVQAMQAGALDYILKPFKMSAILPVLSRAVAVRRLRLENLELRNTVAIHELNQAIAHTLDPNVLLDKIIDAAMAQFEADEASIMLLAEDGEYLYIAAVRGERPDTLLGTRVPIGQGIAGQVAIRREPLVLQGELKDPRLAPLRPRAGIQSALSMPMITRNKLIGVLNVNYTRQPRTIPFGQIKVLSIFVNAAAAGLEAARLYEEQRKADARYREVLHMAADGIISMDEGQRIVIFNGGAEKVFGYRSEEALGQPLEMLLPVEAAETHRRHVASFGRGPDQSRAMGARDRRLFGRRKDGTPVNVEVGISKHTERGKTLYTAIVRDITLRVQQEDKIARLTRIQRMLSGINSTIVRVRDRQELFDEACRIAVEHGSFGMAWIGSYDPAAQELTPVASAGVGAIEYAGGAKFAVHDDLPEGQGILAQAIKSRKPVFDNDITLAPEVGGQRRAEAIGRGYRSVIVLPLIVEGEAVGSISLLAKEPNFFDDEEIKLLTELSGDVSFALDHIAKEQKLDYLAYYDALTGLPNRRLFNDRLQQRVSAARRDRKAFAVVMLDLERFRNINETLGRHAGDELLRQIGQRLNNALAETDILAHIGGDHFAIATRRDEGEDVAHILQQLLRAAFGQPFQIGDSELRVAIRAGIAVYPADGTDTDSLLRNAEAALRKAKASGERYLFYQPQMNATVAENLLLENKLRQALEKEQFVLHYQPKVDLAKGTVSGLEALIRWNDPETGLVPPMRFIPLLEETGMILDVGRWAILKALEDCRQWRARGLLPPRIAVNVSPIQVRQTDFVNVVRDAIGESPAGSHGLDLEITESLIMEDIGGNIEKLRAVRNMGVNIAIDDFGTGFSSLGYLAKLPVNALKIDRSFIITMVNDTDSMTIVSAVISLAHSLNLKVIAEGVESEDQRNRLKLLKCDQMQGYLFSPPLPAAEVEAKFLGAAAAT